MSMRSQEESPGIIIDKNMAKGREEGRKGIVVFFFVRKESHAQ
jgi:hypothetical protein